MKNLKKVSTFLLIFSLLALPFSCADDANVLEENRKTKSGLDYSDPVLNYIIGLGFLESEIVDAGNEYVVEGDIVFPKEMIAKSLNQSGRTSQSYSNTLVELVRQANIRVMLDPTMSSFSAEASSAISHWNNAGSNIHFNIVSSAPYDILIVRNDNLGNQICADAGYPINGAPYHRIRVNVAKIGSWSYTDRTMNLVHELGHCIGLWHTDFTGTSRDDLGNTWSSVPVPGVGTTDDPFSIMNYQICDDYKSQLSIKDKAAIQVLYANPKPANTTIEITGTQFTIRWSNPTILGPGDTHFANEVSYGGFSGVNFGGTVSLSATSTFFVVPGVTPYPSSNGTNGGIQVTVRAKYSNGTYAGQTVSRTKVNGVWQ